MAEKVTSRVWFGRKTFGWGLRPVRWQGWMVTGLYLLLVFVLTRALAARHMAEFVIALVVLTVAYAMIALATSDQR
jgi:Mn2+/Fe2+ NRAMP family transporter